MRRLYLLRHSKTEPGEPGRPDRNRALTERGRADAARIGAYLERHALMPARVLLSPARRVQETWQYLTEAVRKAPATTTVDNIYDAGARDIMTEIAETPADAASLMIVGHNPTLHELAVVLIASGDIDAREALREGLPTSGLVAIDFAYDEWQKLHPQSGRLERFVTPRSLDPATN